jgi:hypothetical protein
MEVFFSNHLLGINQPNGLVFAACHTLLQEKNMFQTVQEAVYPLNLQLNQPSQTISAQVIHYKTWNNNNVQGQIQAPPEGDVPPYNCQKNNHPNPNSKYVDNHPNPKSKDVGVESEIDTNIQSNQSKCSADSVEEPNEPGENSLDAINHDRQPDNQYNLLIELGPEDGGPVTRGEFMALACQCHSMCFYCNPVPMILCVSSI